MLRILFVLVKLFDVQFTLFPKRTAPFFTVRLRYAHETYFQLAYTRCVIKRRVPYSSNSLFSFYISFLSRKNMYLLLTLVLLVTPTFKTFFLASNHDYLRKWTCDQFHRTPSKFVIYYINNVKLKFIKNINDSRSFSNNPLYQWNKEMYSHQKYNKLSFLID